MIYESDMRVTMRVVEAEGNNNVTASKDLKYNGTTGEHDGQQYTALVPTSDEENVPYIVFFWNKAEDASPSICFDLEKGDFSNPDSFKEVALADITSEYLQQFYKTEEPTYKSIMTAKNKVLSERNVIKKSYGEDTYSGICDLLDGDDDEGNMPSYQDNDDINDNDANYGNDHSSSTHNSSSYDDDDDYDSDASYDGSNNSSSSSSNSTSNTGHDNSTTEESNNASSNNNNTPSNSSSNSGINTGNNSSTNNGNNSSTNNGDNKPPSHDPNTTLHLVFIADITDSKIGIACKMDYDNFHNEMKSIAESLGIKFREYPVMDADFTKEGIEQALNDLKPSANDIVFFVYSGHGGRYEQKDDDPFPAIYRRTKDQKSWRFFYFSKIYTEICAKKARLNFVLTDCCNTKPSSRSIQATSSLYSRANNNYSLARLGQLFLKERGSMIATASSPGEVAWSSIRNGGFFLTSFLTTLRSAVHAANNQALSWNTLMDDTFVLALEKSTHCRTQQHGVKKSTFK